jgi:hypothetical protein
MTEFEQKCYGMSADDIRSEYMNGLTARLSGLEMVVMGILSDCQEVLMFGTSMENGSKVVSPRAAESSRKMMNIAKFILSEMMDAKSEKETA